MTWLTKLSKFLPGTRHEIMAHRTHRLLVGIAGVTLPFLLWWANGSLEPSISDFYWKEDARHIFVGVMFVVGVFLCADVRPGRVLLWLAGPAAGACAILVALIPVPRGETEPNASYPNEDGTRLHYVLAFSLFCLLSLKCGLAFRNGEDKLKDKIYCACSILMLALPLAIIAIGNLRDATDKPGESGPVLYAEAISLIVFGVAWFLKGRPIEFLRGFGCALREWVEKQEKSEKQ